MKWNPATNLPSPGCPLVCLLYDDEEVEAIRPQHVRDRDGDPGYIGSDGMRLVGVVSWRYK